MSKSAPVWPCLAFNSDGEQLEVYPDLVINLEYWDCECERDYIHALDKTVCEKCGQTQELGPSSHENEVREMVKSTRFQSDYKEHDAGQALLPKFGDI
ncbi:MAG: hypothetical protein OXU96_07370 [Gammaproteobacteria bacterium]|nr:hypothetical protein [Gammaproteobacteria bacterium]